MAMEGLKQKYIPSDNDFYRNNYHKVLYVIMGIIVFLIICVFFILIQIYTRPSPVFIAYTPKGEKRELTAFQEPNLLPDTILRWASKAATLGYSFDFVNYRKQMDEVRPYFTDHGWADYQSSLSGPLSSIVQKQLIVTSVVNGTPVISNQGPLPGIDYAWRVQIPFLVTYQSSSSSTQQKYYVILTIVRVPTSTNPQGIGIDQFVMA